MNTTSTPIRIRVPEWIQGQSATESFVVRIEVEAVILHDDATEPCFEPAVVRQLEEWQKLADAGRMGDLAKIGDVFMRGSA